MNQIIKSFLSTHIKEYAIDDMKEDKAFEHFINRIIINKYSIERFDPDTIMTDDGEKGLDGVAIIINERLITEKEELESIIANDSEIDVRFVFIQSKTSERFSSSEIGDFIYGVKAFFESKEKRPTTNEKMENLISIKDLVYENSISLSSPPVLDLYYVCCGKWSDTNGIQKRIDIEIQPLIDNSDFSKVEFYKYDSEKIITTFKELKKKISRSILMEKRATFPSINGVKQAYIGFVKCKDYIKLLEDSDGNILNNIFEDNVRDFQGYNVINSEIKNTLENDEDQDRFAVLNNGITIVARGIQITGDNIEISDYQIVNGCQTSYVLFDNQSKINQNSYIVIKLIEVEDSSIAERVIYTTNRQTEVKSEAFISSNRFHKQLQDYFNSIDPNYKLYYERRSKQYDLDDSINKNKVISLSILIASYIAMFLNEPQSTHRYYGELLSSYKNRIFLDTDCYDVYYISTYYNYFVEQQFRIQHISKELRQYKYHIICAMRCLLVGKSINYGKAKKQKREFDTLFTIIKDERKSKQTFSTAIMCLKEVLNKTSVPEQARYRSKEFTNELLSEIDNVSEASNSTEYLKVGDIVHCTVSGVDKTFVNVTIKTEDIRNYGFIHISNVANKWIENLLDEVKIGEIFQAKIIEDIDYSNNHGWGLTRIY